MNDKMYLPSLSHWEYGNVWSGGRGRSRYLITPAEGEMKVELWTGPLSRAFVEPEVTAAFPISDEGIEEMRAFLVEQMDIINQT